MDDPLVSAGCVAADPHEAYAHLTVGVVVTDAHGQVVLANPIAESIFAPLQPALFGLRTLLGLSSASGGADLAALAEAAEREAETGAETAAASAAIRIGFPNGRMFEAGCRRLPDGGNIITLFDVTSYIQTAALTVRDALTGLATRTSFQTHLEQAVAKRQHGGESVPCSASISTGSRSSTIRWAIRSAMPCC